MQSSNSATILWATQSGRAKACARRTIRLLQSSSASSSISSRDIINIQGRCAFDDVDFLSLGCGHDHRQSSPDNNDHHQQQQQHQHQQQQRLLILFVSTTGDAELPTTIQRTWSRLLSKSTVPPDHFSNVRFALFALGDRSYGPDAFCAAGRKLAARMVQLGAAPICRLGYGDDGSPNGGVFADLDVWLEEELFPALTSDPGQIISSRQGGDVDGGGGGGVDGDDDMDRNAQQQQRAQSNRVRGDCDPPYRVRVIRKTINEDGSTATRNRPLDDADGVEKEEVEWQREEYAQYYGDYFARSRPATSYQYNEGLERIGPTQTQSQEHRQISNSGANAPLLGRVIVNERMTAEGWMQDTRHLRIHIFERGVTTLRTGSDVQYRSSKTSDENHPRGHALPYLAGDVATILPHNPTDLVRRFLMVLPPSIRELADETLRIRYDPDQLGTSTMNNHPWPESCTLRGLLTHCADIQSLPEREDLFALSSYCNLHHDHGVDQRAKLIALSEPTGAALYGDYIVREKRNWVDVFYDFDSLRCCKVEKKGDGSNVDAETTTTNIASKDDSEKGRAFVRMTISHLLALLPSIAPRHFSIASSPSYMKLEIEPLSLSGYNRGGDDCETAKRGFDIELCVAVVEGTTPLGRPYAGCCSKYLTSIMPNDKDDDAILLGVSETEAVDADSGNAKKKKKKKKKKKGSDVICMWIHPGSFSGLPLQLRDDAQREDKDSTTSERNRYFQTPVMCIGAGTGIAPLRSLILEREYQVQSKIGNALPSPSSSNDFFGSAADVSLLLDDDDDDMDNILVFGCRKKTSDYYYGHEWTSLVRDKRLGLISAFSRDQGHGKLYVQRALRESNGGELIATHLLKRRGAVYIAGGSKMARAVKDEIVVALGAVLDGGEKDAKRFLNKLKRMGLFSIEAWS
ncbi:hypothetical protein ACHAW5_006517 [Stephanodiscus triporus]|uniref:Nitric-oxide synthase (NADPH) n=1 Tax=Stephanodiscus triporus TaxID=2934178 RepID=A0ABD3NAF5_9STRA